MQRNNRPGKGDPKNSPRPKRDSARNSEKKPFSDRPYKKSTDSGPDKDRERNSRPGRPFTKSSDGDSRPRRTFDKSNDGDSRPRRTFDKSGDGDSRPRRTFDKSGDGDSRPRRTFDKSGNTDRPRRTFDKGGDTDRPRRTFDKSSEGDRPRRIFDKSGDGESRPHRSFDKSSDGDNYPRRTFNKSGDAESHPRRTFDKSGDSESRPRRTFDKSGAGDNRPRRTFDKSSDGDNRPRRSFDRSDDRTSRPSRTFDKKRDDHSGKFAKDKDGRRSFDRKPKDGTPSGDGLVRLNKYLANAGIASRREADELIQAGAVMVNGVVVTELGTKISPSDKVQYGQQTIRKEKHVYVLLNKPKGYITTTDDPFDRNTVMTLIADAGKERIYPVGRLDRNTSGLLLFTNDGELAKKLTHPSHKVRKVYHVELDKALTKNDLLKIGEGIELEDGMAFIDEITYAEDGKNKKEIGIELHTGRNRIVRRIFEALGYEVEKLDRVVFAGLNKKDLPRGHWRFLTEKEVSFLQMIK